MINAWAVTAVCLSRCGAWIWPCWAWRIKKDHFWSGHLLAYACAIWRERDTHQRVPSLNASTDAGQQTVQVVFVPPVSRLWSIWWTGFVTAMWAFSRVWGGHRRLADWFDKSMPVDCSRSMLLYTIVSHENDFDPARKWHYSLHNPLRDNVVAKSQWDWSTVSVNSWEMLY